MFKPVLVAKQLELTLIARIQVHELETIDQQEGLVLFELVNVIELLLPLF